MNLNYLHIDKYKNIQNKDFDFSKNTGCIALIGENGSGKSNLLEAISIIFIEILLEGIPLKWGAFIYFMLCDT